MAIITAGEVGGVTHKCHKRNGEGFVARQQHSNNILTAVISPAVIAAGEVAGGGGRTQVEF